LLHTRVYEICGGATGDSLDAAEASADAALAENMEIADFPGESDVSAAAELGADGRLADTHHPDDIPVLLIEKGDGAAGNGLLIVGLLVPDPKVAAYAIIDDTLDGPDFLRGHGGEVREIKAEAVRGDQRAALLDMLAENPAQGSLEEMGGGMIAGDIMTALDIDDGVDGLPHF
jgi:hypothetical protein